jgi:hypothetical protein
MATRLTATGKAPGEGLCLQAFLAGSTRVRLRPMRKVVGSTWVALAVVGCE